MALRRCLGCSTLFAVGLLRCPLCKGLEHVEEGNEAAMPKITLHGGPSIAEEVITEEDDSCPGNSSSPSELKPEISRSTTDIDEGSIAPLMDGLSKKVPTAPSSARSTGGRKSKTKRR